MSPPRKRISLPSLYDSPTHPDLHSFPTRRSSDLSIHGGANLRGDQWPPAAVGRMRDRKSTRLNSSHVSISYAVFCLKKKKRDRTRLPSSRHLKSSSYSNPVRAQYHRTASSR